MIVTRDLYLDRLKRKANNGLVKVVTGLRRSGKSFLLMTLFKNWLLEAGVKSENILAIDLESDDNRALRNPDELSAYFKHISTKDREDVTSLSMRPKWPSRKVS